MICDTSNMICDSCRLWALIFDDGEVLNMDLAIARIMFADNEEWFLCTEHFSFVRDLVSDIAGVLVMGL